ncbi:hypothetical protein [Streptomyces sp. NBC_01622]|uniref:hypothetical protein n=1 Tax=Streptomyces sp. NBC_01622 TaxID=2975903 RepID=UPI00387094A3
MGLAGTTATWWMHNGAIAGFHLMRRELSLLVGRDHGVEFPLQMTIAVTDGQRLWAFRHSSQGASRSLFYSTRVDALRELHPDMAFLQGVSDETRLIVSEPLGDLPGAWNEVPESSYGVVQAGADELHPFVPEPA